MTTDELKLRTLTERFLDGETTLDEEQWLYECYGRGDVPDDLKPLRRMFADYAALGTATAGLPDAAAPKPARGRRHWWAAAAAAAVLLAAGAVGVARYAQADECVAYVYGQRVTDRRQVLAEMQLSLGTLADAPATDAVDAQLRELFATDE